MPELTLGQALEGLGVSADDVLDSRVFPDRVVVILRSGPKLRWPPLQASRDKPPSESAQPAAETTGPRSLEAGVEGSGPGGKVSAKDIRATAAKRRRAGGE